MILSVLVYAVSFIDECHTTDREEVCVPAMQTLKADDNDTSTSPICTDRFLQMLPRFHSFCNVIAYITHTTLYFISFS